MSEQSGHRPRIIVMGNEKGGSGKSTTAMHLTISLLGQGRRVAVLDLDSRQRSLTRYLENRAAWSAEKGLPLAMPECRVLAPSQNESLSAGRAEDREAMLDTLSDLAATNDIILIDCPGTDTHLARLAHVRADLLVTPINDSFVDLDLLARVNPDTHAIKGPSLYAEMVWEARKRRAMEEKASIDWVVFRNRMSTLNARNKQRIEQVLEQLSRRIGFRFAPGLSERVIYRELFLKGLTLMDLKTASRAGAMGKSLTMSHVAARQEVRRLVESLNLPDLAQPEDIALAKAI